LHTVELDMQLGFIRQTGLAQNRLLYVVFFVLRSIYLKAETAMK
jgi:hypothetical protein